MATMFSQRLQKLLAGTQPKTLLSLINNFEEKSFGILFLLLLILPALPLPTGGVTHIFEIIAMLLALELIIGRKTVWLPKRWLDKTLPKGLQTSALPRFIKIVRWVERYSRPRLRQVQNNSFFARIMGVIVLLFTVFAFLAPPFSGLDTLPALGVVLLSLGVIFEDILLSAAGVIVGGIGVGLIFLFGRLVLQLL